MGLNASFESGLVDTPASGNETLTSFGAQFGFDFAKRSEVPIALSLAYRGLTGGGRTADVGGSYRIYELGMFYTGRSQFVVGGDFSLSRVALREGVGDLDAVQFRIVTRIDF